jgi:hypothetical protein
LTMGLLMDLLMGLLMGLLMALLTLCWFRGLATHNEFVKEIYGVFFSRVKPCSIIADRVFIFEELWLVCGIWKQVTSTAYICKFYSKKGKL